MGQIRIWPASIKRTPGGYVGRTGGRQRSAWRIALPTRRVKQATMVDGAVGIARDALSDRDGGAMDGCAQAPVSALLPQARQHRHRGVLPGAAAVPAPSIFHR